jgi:CheY-like chemotaxis protein
VAETVEKAQTAEEAKEAKIEALAETEPSGEPKTVAKESELAKERVKTQTESGTEETEQANSKGGEGRKVLPLPDIDLPTNSEQGSGITPQQVPLPPSPFTADETYSSAKEELPAFINTENEVNPPDIAETAASNGIASAQEIEQSLRPGQACRLLLAVSRPERMAQLNTLVRSAGYEVRPAFDGPHALGLLRIDRPDLLLLDYEVRGLNGLETLHRIQAQHNGRLPVPVILLADQPAPEIKAEAEALGVLKIINIPYAPIELLAAMRQAVSKS